MLPDTKWRLCEIRELTNMKSDNILHLKLLEGFTMNGLLSELRDIRKAVAASNDSAGYLDSQKNNVVLKSKFYNVAIGIVFYILCSTILFPILSFPPINFLLNLVGLNNGFIIQLIILAATVFVTIKGRSYLNKYIAKRRMVSNGGTIQKQIQIKNGAIDYLVNQELLPEDYLNLHAIDHMIKYLKNDRADTIREAINLYEIDVINTRHENILRDAQAKANYAASVAGTRTVIYRK